MTTKAQATTVAMPIQAMMAQAPTEPSNQIGNSKD
jgi:hypothetical protein